MMTVNIQTALQMINAKIKEHKSNKPFVIAIDGRSASGKTTFAEMLGTTVIHTDDFFRPRNSKNELELDDYSGNFDIERFKTQIVANLTDGTSFEYGIFDCQAQAISKTVTVPSFKCIAVEGAYCTHPMLGEYADLKLFFEISREEQLRRIAVRNGENGLKAFSNIWIPAEERYFSHYAIKEKSHIIISTEV